LLANESVSEEVYALQLVCWKESESASGDAWEVEESLIEQAQIELAFCVLKVLKWDCVTSSERNVETSWRRAHQQQQSASENNGGVE
jgi:hypothetical protein